MRQNLLDLYEIQKIDLEIREQESQRDQIPQQLRDHEAALTRLEQQANQLAEQRGQAEREARTLQATIEDERDKIRKWEARLGELRNQREYQALHRETEGQRRANRDNEEKLQELYRTQQQQTEASDALQEKLGEARKRAEAERAEVEGRLAALDEVVEVRRLRRETLLPRVPKTLFRRYDAIRAKRMGQGMCLVSSGNCVGCNMRLPPQLYNTLQRGQTAEQCPSCHRIIYWDQLLAQDLAAQKEAGSDAARGATEHAGGELAHPA